ncbi:hypothetical protein OAK75_13535, partial [Bacteriovoracales bacterium]|nr:hypothetical protein [Bacteriovoracales bacterium]
ILKYIPLNSGKFLLVPNILTFIFAIKTSLLLSFPSTYNLAYNYIVENVNNQNFLIINDTVKVQLPMNSKSYKNFFQSSCSTRCKTISTNNINTHFNSMVIAKEKSKPIKNLNEFKKVFIITHDKNKEGKIIKSFFNKEEHGRWNGFEADHNNGDFFNFSFLLIKNFGPNIYIKTLESKKG